LDDGLKSPGELALKCSCRKWTMAELENVKKWGQPPPRKWDNG